MTSKRQTKPAVDSGDCRAGLAELFAYLDGELSEERCQAIERHLANCACCGALAGNLRRAIAACRVSGHERLPPRVRSRAQARVTALLESAGTHNPPGRRSVKKKGRTLAERPARRKPSGR
jgi:anti-sigma factor RsiW